MVDQMMDAEPSHVSCSRPLTLGPRPLDFEQQWPRILSVINTVMNGETCTNAVWDDCFFDVYGLCSSSLVTDLYARLVTTIGELISSLTTSLKTLELNELISEYAASWLKFKHGITHLSKLFSYLNRLANRKVTMLTFQRRFPDVACKIDTHHTDIDSVARCLWRRELLKPLFEPLFRGLISDIDDIRNSNYSRSPRPDTIATLNSYVHVCLANDNDLETLLFTLDKQVSGRFQTPFFLKFYEDAFETRFIQHSKAYFKHLMQSQLQYVDMREYMTIATRILDKEQQLATDTFYAPTQLKIMVMLKELFIKEQLALFKEHMPDYVRNEKRAELRLGYNLLVYFPESLQILIKEYESHITRTLKEKMDSLMPSLTASVFTEATYAKHMYYTEFCREIFNDCKCMHAAQRRAIESVINEERCGEKLFGAKMLAKHVDILLRKQNKNKTINVEEKIESAVTVFRYITDKEAFHKIFQRYTSNRLLGGLYFSMEMEEMVIERLKIACGSEYTAKLCRMHHDVIKSKQLIKDYYEQNATVCGHEHMAGNDFIILKTCAWPVASSSEDPQLSKMRVPDDLLSFVTCFKQLYEQKHTGRILKVAYHVSCADVRISLSQKKCYVTMTVPQVMILLCFESTDRRTLQYIMDHTGLNLDYVKSCLKAFEDFKLLKVVDKVVTPQTMVAVNLQFEPLRSRVILQPPQTISKANETNQISSTREGVEDRKYAVHCSIMKIMKARKLLKHAELAELVCNTIASRFVPDNTLLKSCIEDMIDKHNIQRTNSIDEYEYIP